VAALVGWLRPKGGESSASDLPPTQLALLLPDFGGAGTALRHQLEISPDGTALLYVALVDGVTRTKWIALDGTEGRVLESVQPNTADYRMAPDGRSFLATSENGAIYRYPIGGATGRPLPRGVQRGLRAESASDGSEFLRDVTASYGNTKNTPEEIVSLPFLPRNADHSIMQILPGDRMALTVRQPVGTATGPAMLLDLSTGESRMLIDDVVVEVRYAAGHLVYVLGDGTLQAAPFDLKALRTTAPPVTLASGVVLTGAGLAQFAVASNGTIAYAGEAGRTLLVADRAGAGKPVLAAMRNYHHPRYSPDGKRISMDFNATDGRDVWILSLDDGALTRATFDRDGHDAVWSPDGRSIAYTSFRGGVFGVHRIRPGSTETSDSLLTSPLLAYTGIWLRDQSALVTVGQTLRPESNLDIGILRNAGRGPVEPLVATRFLEQHPALSRDDRWLAYTSNQSGREEIYVRPLTGGEQIQVSVGGGTEPVWSPDGRELFYRGGAGDEARREPMIMAASIATTPALAVTSRKALFPATGIVTANPHPNFDVSPDGRTFAYVRANPSSRVIVIQNLAAMVAKRRAGARTTP
jgi:serine/threonine-protein kinase